MKIETGQLSFNGGELDPALWSRNDLEKYAAGLALAENFIVRPHGGAYKRPGLRLIDDALETDKPERFITFKFSTIQSYALEFGDRRMRIIKDDALVAYPEGHELAGQTVVVEAPYAAEDLERLRFAQRSDFMVITHPNYHIHTLKRMDNHHTWVFSEAAFIDDENMPIASPTGLRLTKDGKNGAMYCVAAVMANGNESLASAVISCTTASGLGLPVPDTSRMGIEQCYQYWTGTLRQTWPAEWNIWTMSASAIVQSYLPRVGFYGLSWEIKNNEIRAEIYSPTGNYHKYLLDKGYWFPLAVQYTDAGYGNILATMRQRINQYVADYNENATPNGFSKLSYNAVNNAATYYIFRAASEGDSFYLIGTTTETTFEDDNLPYDPRGIGPVITDNPFSGPNQKPGVCLFFEQRLVLARSNELPQRFWGSQTGDYFDFGKHSPVQDDDSYAFDLDSVEANEILWAVPLNEILFGTSGGEWKAGGGNQAITPSNVNAREQSAWGCSPVQPVTVGRSIVFAGRSGRVLRDLSYSLEADGFDGDDLTIYAQHLFAERTVKEIAYQQEPSSVLWIVMSDGSLLSCTYLPKQRVVAWSRHHTPEGKFENVASLVNIDGTDRVYFVVSRPTSDGRSRKTIEVLKDSMIPGNDIKDMHYLDCGLTYEGDPTDGVLNLDHLEGREVDVLADGNHSRRLVENGRIDLDHPASVVHVGLVYAATLETLDMQPPQQPVKARPHDLVKAELHLDRSVSCLVGPIDGEGDEIIHPEDEGWPDLRSGLFETLPEKPSAGTPGFRLRIVSDKPYPLCVLAINAVGELGGQ